jgi:hypothetical protein
MRGQWCAGSPTPTPADRDGLFDVWLKRPGPYSRGPADLVAESFAFVVVAWTPYVDRFGLGTLPEDPPNHGGIDYEESHVGEAGEVRRQFREATVSLVQETGKPIAQIARDLGVNEALT